MPDPDAYGLDRGHRPDTKYVVAVTRRTVRSGFCAYVLCSGTRAFVDSGTRCSDMTRVVGCTQYSVLSTQSQCTRIRPEI